MRERGSLERIRVLRIITRLNVGGPALHASLLTSLLDPERFETTLVAGREAAGEAGMAALGRLSPGLRSLTIPTLHRELAPIDDVRALAALVAIARRLRPHIVHTHLAKAGAIGRIAARLVGTPVVLHTFHGTVFSGYFGSRASNLYLASERGLARITTRLIAISPSVRAELERLRVAAAGKIVEIPLGLDLAPFIGAPERHVARERLGLQQDARYVAIVGRLVAIKDVTTFLRAFALLNARRPDVHALVVGDGPERAELEELAVTLGIGGCCRFLGWVADMPGLYAAADVVALSSLNEGTPVALIEAMAAGRPIVATSVGGVPDAVSSGAGSLVPPGRPEEFADALARSFDSGGSVGTAARSDVVRRFSAERLTRDMEALYLELLRDAKSR